MVIIITTCMTTDSFPVTITTVSLPLLLLLSLLPSPLWFGKKAGKALIEVIPTEGTSVLECYSPLSDSVQQGVHSQNPIASI